MSNSEVRIHLGTMSQWWLSHGIIDDEKMRDMASVLERDSPVFWYRGARYQVLSVVVEGDAFVAECRSIAESEQEVEAEVAVTA